MWAGIQYQGLHSYRDFGATMAERAPKLPPKDRVTDRAPYSSVTEDFTAAYGSPSFGERTLPYKFVLSDIRGGDYLTERVERFVSWLYLPVGKSALYDDRQPGYHYMAVCTAISEPKIIGGVVAEITVTFTADPFRIPNVPEEKKAILLSDARFPDLNGDGQADTTEAAMILEAAAHIGIGEPSGLTEEQEYLADCDRDGEITSTDAALVSQFAALCGVGRYTNTPEGWLEFLNYALDRWPEVL